MTVSQGQAILAYMKKARSAGKPPAVPADDKTAILVFGRHCVRCHTLDGDGGRAGPDLTHAGERRASDFLHTWIVEPRSIYAEAHMPGFGSRLSKQELGALVAYLARRE